MSSPPPLPVELFHEILQSLRNDFQTLQQCALVCSTLRYIVQQYLFFELSIHRFPHRNTCSIDGTLDVKDDGESRCSWLLKPAHSHLLSHVRHLRIQCYPSSTHSSSSTSTSAPDPSFLSVLERIPVDSIHKITILRRFRDDPLADTERVVTRLLRRCTTLRELSLEDRRVPASYLSAVASSIKVLRVLGTEFVEDGVDGVGVDDDGGFVSSWPRLEALIFPGKLSHECLSWMVVRSVGAECVFPRLKMLFVGDECKDVEVPNQVLQMCKSTLRSFVYTPFCYNFSSYPNPCFNQNGTAIEFTIPPTLRRLAINCPVMLKPASQHYPNPFGWLNHTFRKLSRDQPCFLETIHIKFLTTKPIERLDALFPGGFPNDRCFHEFDKLLSSKDRFPRLSKVYLTVGRHYLRLFMDPETLPTLNTRGLVGLVFEDVFRKRFWLCSSATGQGDMESVESLPWDGRVGVPI